MHYIAEFIYMDASLKLVNKSVLEPVLQSQFTVRNSVFRTSGSSGSRSLLLGKLGPAPLQSAVCDCASVDAPLTSPTLLVSLLVYSSSRAACAIAGFWCGLFRNYPQVLMTQRGRPILRLQMRTGRSSVIIAGCLMVSRYSLSFSPFNYTSISISIYTCCT